MFKTIINTDIAHELMERYYKKFIKPDYENWNTEFNCRNLPWCYYKEERKVYDTTEIYRVPISPTMIVYCHDEQKRILYQTTFIDVYNLVINLEPWEEVDIEVFNDEMEWTIAITHEDCFILVGIDLVDA
jgi:hypothetical protein